MSDDKEEGGEVSIEHCQYCGARAALRVHVVPASGSDRTAFRHRTGSFEFTVCSCFMHAEYAVVHKPLTHCRDTGKPRASCECYWCVGDRRTLRDDPYDRACLPCSHAASEVAK